MYESLPPVARPAAVNVISRYLPNLLELVLITVWAFPNASSSGFTCRIRSSNVRFDALQIVLINDHSVTSPRRNTNALGDDILQDERPSISVECNAANAIEVTNYGGDLHEDGLMTSWTAVDVQFLKLWIGEWYSDIEEGH